MPHAWMRAFVLSLLVVALGAPLTAESLYIETKLLITGDGDEIEGGVVVVEGGRIKRVGPAEKVNPPPYHRRVDATEFVVMPGFVVAASRIGMPSSGPAIQRSDQPYRPAMDSWLKAADDFYPFHASLPSLLEAGVTSLVLLPNGSSGIVGQGALIRTARGQEEGEVREEMLALVLSVDDRTAWREGISKAFEGAKTKLEAKRKLEKKGKKSSPPCDPGEAAMQKAVAGEIPLVVVNADGAEWATLRATLDPDEYPDLKLVLEDSGDLYKAAPSLAEAGVTVLVRPVLSNEQFTRYPINKAATFHQAGASIAFTLPTDNIDGARRMFDALGKISRAGLGREQTLIAATHGAAKAHGLGKKVGRVFPGVSADLLFLSGDPLDPTTSIVKVMQGGEFVVGEEEEE